MQRKRNNLLWCWFNMITLFPQISWEYKHINQLYILSTLTFVKVILPIIIDASCLNIVCHVSSNGCGKDKSAAYPKRTWQVTEAFLVWEATNRGQIITILAQYWKLLTVDLWLHRRDAFNHTVFMKVDEEKVYIEFIFHSFNKYLHALHTQLTKISISVWCIHKQV